MKYLCSRNCFAQQPLEADCHARLSCLNSCWKYFSSVWALFNSLIKTYSHCPYWNTLRMTRNMHLPQKSHSKMPLHMIINIHIQLLLTVSVRKSTLVYTSSTNCLGQVKMIVATVNSNCFLLQWCAINELLTHLLTRYTGDTRQFLHLSAWWWPNVQSAKQSVFLLVTLPSVHWCYTFTSSKSVVKWSLNQTYI